MRRACLCLLMALALLPATRPARAQGTAGSYLARASRERSRRRPRRELAILRRGLARLPGDLELTLALVDALTTRDASRARLDAEEVQHAREAFEALTDAAVEDPQRRHSIDLRLAWLRALSGDCAGASRDITREDPRVDRAAALTLREIAALAIRRSELEVASFALSGARAADATLEGVDLAQAAVAAARGQDERTVELLRARLDGHPDDDATLHALAGALLASGRIEEALRLYRLRVAHCPSPGLCRRDWVRAALQGRDFDQAREGARELLALPSPEAASFTLLGLAEVGLGHLEAAKDAFRAALRLDPEDVQARASMRALSGEDAVESAPRSSPAMLRP